MPAAVEHVIVIALENRSFDHLLGYVQHPDPLFDGLTKGGPYTNPPWRGQGPPVEVSSDAKPVLPVDPDHSHDAVMQQLDLRGRGPARRATNQGFVASYEEKGRGLAAPQFEGLFGPIANLVARRKAGTGQVEGRGPLVMRCQAQEQVPVLATLALEFGVCSRWFSSVPGETWPNRNFMHAATSDGTTDIELRFYTDPTIFELLEEGGRSWHVYHDDTPQVWAFRNLWVPRERRRNWFVFGEFARHVREGRLPHYSFIEPNHHPPVHVSPGGGGHGDTSNSQHPGNNRVANADYDGYPQNGRGNEDFRRAEQLVASVYEALRSSPALFERSLLLITYDEHGGLYDHVAPPTDAHPPADPPSPGLLGRILWFLFRRKVAAFDFTMYGVRVPTVVVSPHVRAGTVSADVRDHASIPATLRALFAPDAKPLTRRDEHAVRFDTLLGLDQPRASGDLPDLSSHLPPVPIATREAVLAPPEEVAAGAEPSLPGYYQDFVELADQVAEELAKVAPAEAAEGLAAPAPTAELGPRARARQVTAAFAAAADAARRDDG
jgi:phospholipase C